MSTLPAFIEASKARAASTDAAMLAQAAKNAQGALQWALAASLYDQAADALPRDSHTGDETLQAKAHRRSARNCRALVNTKAPNRLIKDNPDYQATLKQLRREAEAEQDTYWRPA